MNTQNVQFSDLNLDPAEVYLDERFHRGAKYDRFVKSKSGKVFSLTLFTPKHGHPLYPTDWISIRQIHSDGNSSYHGSQMRDNLDQIAERIHQLY